MSFEMLAQRHGCKAAHYALLIGLAACTMACAETKTETMTPHGFVSRYSREGQAIEVQKQASNAGASNAAPAPTFDSIRIYHATGEEKIGFPIDAYWKGEQMHVVTRDGGDIGINNVNYISINYIKQDPSGPNSDRRSAGIALLAVGAPIFLVSTGLFASVIVSPSEGGIPVFAIAPLVSLGSLGLVIPGLVMLKSNSNQTAAWRHPTIQVYPGGIRMSTAF